MKFALDPGSRSPLYRQLEEQILYAVSVGELRPGDRLPSIRELEQELGVNRNTVRRTYLDLQAKGTIRLRRGQVAQVAEQTPIGTEVGTDLTDTAEELAVEMLRRCEASGLDGLEFARYHAGIAREHDVRYPKCAFVECNDGMAETIARQVGERLGRHVVPVNLGDEHAASGLPSSVRFVFAPHWHLAEAKRLLAERHLRIFQLELRLEPDCVSRLGALSGKRVIVVVRDARSAPGYRQLLRRYVGGATVEVALAEAVAASPTVLDAYDCVVHTTPCHDIVRSVVPASRILELVFEPSPDALAGIGRQMFPALGRRARPVPR